MRPAGRKCVSASMSVISSASSILSLLKSWPARRREWQCVMPGGPHALRNPGESKVAPYMHREEGLDVEAVVVVDVVRLPQLPAPRSDVGHACLTPRCMHTACMAHLAMPSGQRVAQPPSGERADTHGEHGEHSEPHICPNRESRRVVGGGDGWRRQNLVEHNPHTGRGEGERGGGVSRAKHPQPPSPSSCRCGRRVVRRAAARNDSVRFDDARDVHAIPQEANKNFGALD